MGHDPTGCARRIHSAAQKFPNANGERGIYRGGTDGDRHQQLE